VQTPEEPKEHEHALGTVVPNAPPQPPPPEGQPGKTMVDLIPLIDPRKDTVHGHWLVHENVLHCNDAHFVPRIQIPYEPPEEYDFIVTFSQPGLRNGVSLVMPKPDGSGWFFWHIGGIPHSIGFETTGKKRKADRITELTKAKQIHTTIVEVRRDGVRALLDGKELSKNDGFADLVGDGWRGLRDPKLLGVTCDDPTVFHYVRVVEITGGGKKTR
jgi:hypothetical protein